MAQAARRLIGQRAEKAGVALTQDIPARLPRLFGDVRAVKQVLLNLLTNAVKFTPEKGEVSIAAALAADGDLVLTVSDSGIGMSDADLEQALTPFGQAESDIAREQEGTGLGLPLSKHLVELHGGRLDIESQPGQGTKVRAVFPATRLLPDDDGGGQAKDEGEESESDDAGETGKEDSQGG